MKQGVIPEPLVSLYIDALKDLEDFLLIEKTDEGFLRAFLWDVQYPIGQFPVFWALETKHFGKGFEGSQTLIAGCGKIVALPFKSIEELEDELGGQMLQCQRLYLDTVMVCGKGEKQRKGVSIGFDGIMADAFDMGKVVSEELMD
jgi:hypothetical protein